QPFQPTAQWAALQQWVAQCRQMPSSAHARAELVRNEAGDRSLVVSVQHLGQGRGDETVVVLHDVTQLERLQGFRRDFVADVSHELRTPVAAIRGFAETLLRGRPDAATAREFIDIIHRHAERIGRLVDDLLQLSGLQAQGGRAPQVHAPMPLLPLAERVCASVIRRPDSKHGRVHIDIAPELSLAVDADSLEQVLDNLLTNALRYGLDEGQVWLSACLEDAQVQIEVRDDGPGIAAEHLPRLTERFYRVDAGRSRAQGGTGLGLAIVKELVELLGGSLCITSTVGRGTTCRVTLPGGGAAAQSPTGVQA
ncbi:MAG: sensor histidine kinase, partial [Polyangiales bacterium]